MRARYLIVATALAIGGMMAAAPAQAAPSVSVSNEFGQAQADITYSTKVIVTGSGFQNVVNAHGGVYVAFGTANGNWRPSKGGVTGKDYQYVPDNESKGNQGFLKFVSFTGSDTASSANGGTLAGGRFSTTLTIPGPQFKTVDRNNRVATVDCLKVRCGVITFGAHGVKNANNESFTPVSFTKIYGNDATSPASPSETNAESQSSDTSDETPAKKKPAKKVLAAVKVDAATAVQGRVLAFSGSGFQPGEQVVALLDDGLAGAGPITAGQSGEIAGVIQVPASITAGTHVIRLSGSASKKEAMTNFPVRSETSLAAAESQTEEDWRPWLFMGLGGLVFVLALAVSAVRIRQIRSTRKAHHA